MNKFTSPSKPIIMRIDRKKNIMEIEWIRNLENAQRVLQNFALFDISPTEKMKNEILSFCKNQSLAIRCDKIEI